MILGQSTSRSLPWAGRLLVISLGLCLVPFLPVEAQSPAPRGADRQRQIEALKEALRVLEDQPDQPGGGNKLKDPKNDEEIKKLRDDAEKLSKQIQDRGKQLHDLQAKHRDVLRKLRELGAAGIWSVEDWATPYAGWSNFVYTTPAPAVAAVTAPPARAYRNVAPVATPVPAATAAPWRNVAPVGTPPVMVWETTPAPKTSSTDWEQRLDRLTKEIQELRRELQREKQQGLQKK